MKMPNWMQIRKGILRPKSVLIQLFLADTDSDYNTDGVDVFEEDWDNLILLDACRFDTFKARSTLPGDLEHRISRGAATPEWLSGNFHDRDLCDTVYVTANPMFYQHKDELNTTFHDVWHLWQDDWGWDDELQTVPPSVTAEYARKAAREYPNKRLLIHFNQPHGPLLGPTANDSIVGPGAKPTHERTFLEDLRHRIKIALVSTNEFQQAYNETFDLANDAVEELLPQLQGKTVISADHGEMMGERPKSLPLRHFSHYQGYYKDPLVKVPWQVFEHGTRPDISADPPIETNTLSDDGVEQTVSERLEDLGYMQN